jgi:acetyl esterase/lipase
MRRILKYSVIGTLVLLLVVVVFIGTSLFRTKAPVTVGTVEYGIRYKNNLELDLYFPTRKVFDASPVLFYIHGGAWVGGTKAAINFNRIHGAINTLRERGYTIIAPNYSVAGNNKMVFPECILDVYEAIEWTKKNAAVRGLDTTNLGLLGESAGAHIAMMIAFPDTILQPAKYRKTEFNYVIDVYGPNDLTDLYHSRAAERIDASIGKVLGIIGSDFSIKEYVIGFDPLKDSVRAGELLSRFSPINFVGQKKIPVLILHGNNDQIVPVQQSVILKRKLDALAISNEMHLLDSVDHNFKNASRLQQDSIQVWISEFVSRRYRKNLLV